MDKGRLYKELCEDVQEHYIQNQSKIETQAGKKVYMKWCEDNKEVNLWTYWQGKSYLNPKILLVGQDWGCTTDKAQKNVMENIRAINAGVSKRYMDGNDNSTDKLLSHLFTELGYNDIINNQYQELFFTNLILGYRSVGSSGGYDPCWITETEYHFFGRLVQILQPKVILCLGRKTFEGVLSVYGKKSLIKNKDKYNDFIEDTNRNPVVLDSGIKVYALAHCGSMGTLNRVTAKPKSMDQGEKLQRKDWERISMENPDIKYSGYSGL